MLLVPPVLLLSNFALLLKEKPAIDVLPLFGNSSEPKANNAKFGGLSVQDVLQERFTSSSVALKKGF